MRDLLIIQVAAIASLAWATDVSTVQSCEPELNGTDCLSYPFQKCDELTFSCVHKDLFPLLPNEIVTIVILPFVFAVAAIAGIGGASIFLPILMGLMHFSAVDAIPMGAAMVL